MALGDADMAIGCDQGGSIRIPASWCGIVGMYMCTICIHVIVYSFVSSAALSIIRIYRNTVRHRHVQPWLAGVDREVHGVIIIVCFRPEADTRSGPVHGNCTH